MNIGILTINDFNFHPNFRLRQAAIERKHQILLMNPYHLQTVIRQDDFSFFSSQMTEKPDIILPRQGSPMGDYGLVLLRHFTQMDIPLVNGLEGVTLARNQYLTLQALAAAGIPVPDSCFITDRDGFSKAVETLGGYPVVVKQVDGMGGDGVIKVDRPGDTDAFLDKKLKSRKGLVVQTFIPPEGRKDIRLLVVGDRIAGAMKLAPAEDDFRANIHQQGRAQVLEPEYGMVEMAVQSAKACSLEIAGVDMIIEKEGCPKVIEVNYSPGFRGLETATGRDIARQIIEYLDTRYCDKKEML